MQLECDEVAKFDEVVQNNDTFKIWTSSAFTFSNV